MECKFYCNGGLRLKNNSVCLTVYSTPFARYLIKNDIQKVGLKYSNGNFTITKGNEKKVSLERMNINYPICTFYVTKFLPKELIEELSSSKKQIRTKLIIKGFVSEKDLRGYNNLRTALLPMESINPINENHKIGVGCLITCFRSGRGASYRFSVRHKILEEIANKKDKIALGRDSQGNFIIRKNARGKELSLYKYPLGQTVAYFQIDSSFITEKEKEIFHAGKRGISCRAFLSEKEFNLDISKFFDVKEERELAYALIEKGIKIKIPKMRSQTGDIILRKSNSQIEITNILPKGKNKNNPHTEGIHINGRLCEGFLRVVRKETPVFFMVFNEKWMEHGWVKKLLKKVQPEVIGIATNFEENWTEKVTEKIISSAKE